MNAKSPSSDPMILPLWPEGAPGAKGSAPEDVPTLTIYQPAGVPAAPRAAVVVCPGGGYAGLAEHEGEPIAKWLNTQGITALVLKYRLAPYRHPIQIGDAQRAIRLTRARATEWGIDPHRIGILGFSAGGHLASSAATIFDAGKSDSADPIDRQSSRPDCLVACYPVISLGGLAHPGSRANLLGENPSEALVAELSLQYRVTGDTPPAFLWHTADDSVVAVENVLLFATALSWHKVPFALHVFPKGTHGLGLSTHQPNVGAWTQLCETWLSDIGFGAT